jgi:hypothetical protein
MFQSPAKANSFVAPAEPIDVSQRYLVRVIDLTDQGVSKFADPADPNPVHRIRWVFRLATVDGVPVLNVDGDAYEHFDYTSNKTTKGKMTSQARQWMEALLGPLEDDDIGPDIHTRLKDQVAMALFEENEAGGQDGAESYMRLKIIRMSPYTKGAKPKAEPATTVTF